MNRKSDNQAFKELEILETPMNCIVVGMAGSGKTTLLQRIKAHCNEKSIKAYMINLDPAVYRVPYATDIDIRDSVNYQKVMQNFDLGPNGAILTSLNLFATKFDQVLRLISKRAQSHQYAFIDTPGQVEAFTWSASGAVISESLSTSFPTAILFVVDSTRTKSPVTFMSNMMYACSILYKTNLPLLVVFNKIDLYSHEMAIKWMKDIDLFEEALLEDSTYMATLTSSMGSALSEFYEKIKQVGVSAKTGQGMGKLFDLIGSLEKEYKTDFAPFLLERKKENDLRKSERVNEQILKLNKDINKKI